MPPRHSDIIIDINMIINNKFNLDIPIFVIKYEDLVKVEKFKI